MPRNKVKTSYRKAETTPSRRQRALAGTHPAYVPEAKQPKGLSPLAQYLKDNEDTGISVSELIEQFQEYDCDHSAEEEVARTNERITFVCPICSRVRHQNKPGVK